MNLFEYIYPRFYFDKDKPIRLFEAFSGIGCQAMALKRITDNYELVGFSEIDKPAIQSYKAIHGEVKNYGDITKMVEIPQCDIFTWSFPCTDLSKAGKQKGLDGTRSGLVYEVLRLLKATEIKPKVLIMENVIDLVQVKFVKSFNEIQAELEQLGYTNYNEILNAKDYGIPQNRERVFMVSILKDEVNEHYSYDFPEPKKLELRLKDMVEDEVDEKYYLSKKVLKTLTALNTGKYQRAKAFEFNIKKTIDKGIIGAIPAGNRSGALDPYYAEPQLLQVAQLDGFESSGCIYENGLAPTINTMGGGQRKPKVMIDIASTLGTNCGSSTSAGGGVVLIPEATKKGYAEAHDGDGVYLNRPHQKRGVVQKGMIQTIKTSGDDIGVVVAAKIRTDEGIRTFADNNTGALRTTGSCGDKAVIELSSRNNLRIRKLIPLECWRLMGISDEDFNKAKASGVSNSQLYKQAGNGIVVNVFEAILQELIK